MSFWKDSLSLYVVHTSLISDGESMYKYQCNQLANYLILKDYNPNIKVDFYNLSWDTNFRWPNKGELVSGSFIADAVCKGMGYDGFAVADIDIYFKTREDAKEFCTLNSIWFVDFSDKVKICTYFTSSALKFNLIWGIPYEDATNLISRFDIRAISMAFDPNIKCLHVVNGAISDALGKNIVYNPVPRVVSVARLIKYTQKGFGIDKYQRLFFTELVKTDIYSPELELVTGYGVE